MTCPFSLLCFSYMTESSTGMEMYPLFALIIAVASVYNLYCVFLFFFTRGYGGELMRPAGSVVESKMFKMHCDHKYNAVVVQNVFFLQCAVSLKSFPFPNCLSRTTLSSVSLPYKQIFKTENKCITDTGFQLAGSGLLMTP